ncbi:ABC transporter substrate-binding protein [Kribbella italica]|uniref:Iron complex transport system substrate-binding protein n=1 Tax=Kribbella italica TaxID=1540520 RepID=A0A7W9JFE0_9ACTN|nr:ABC transporter substrate-binding protein [Kribbella italica]MBB5841073.1 iron complex transport system substrate-binding protein [Kribbella italica]
MVLLLDRPEFDNALTRRGFLSVGAGVSAGLLTACSNDDAPEVAADREVATDKGPVRVPVAATRVVCADFYGAFATVDVGLVPVGISGDGYQDSGPSYAGKLAGLPSVGDFTEPAVEKIANVRPDLILRTIDTDDALYRQLSAIAPTVVVSFQRLSLVEVASRVGEVLGRKAEAEALLAEYQKRTQALKAQYAELLAAKTFTLAGAASESPWWTYGPKWTDTKVLLDCGVKLAAPSAAQDKPVVEYSFERLDLLAQSNVLLVPAAPDGTTPGPDAQTLTKQALWRRLPAVRAKQVYPVVTGASSLGNGLELV